MSTRTIYLTLCLLGFILPYAAFLPWLVENGVAPGRLWAAATGEHIALFAWLDVLVSGVVLLVMVVVDGRRLGLRGLWMPVVALFTVGVSLALPLFLYLRETQHPAKS